MITKLKYLAERRWFGVLSRIGQKLGLPIYRLRIFFIYSLFFSLGVSLLGYLGMGIFLWVKDIFIVKRPSVFDI